MEVFERVESLEETVAWFVREMRALRIEDNKAWEKKRKEDNETWEKKMEAEKQERIAERREWNKKWGETANRLGTLVEDVVAPNIEGLALNYFGCKRIDLFTPRIKRTSIRDRSKLREFDCIAICEDCIIVSDTKTAPSADKVDRFIEVLKEIFDYFPEAEGKRLIPIFSSLYLSKDLVTYLTRQNIYALGMGSSTMELLNRQELKNNADSNIEPIEGNS
ncbi:MAG: hypothetical protein HQL03_10655 [Nitrospirae bacterium]|nr:hypothetical protein [Nitrospirota bacterium]MBF0593135.1 hypothetical protein [Nitrospirota bacterium]